MRQLTRQETIIALLETFVEAQDASGTSGEGSGEKDSRPFQMSPLWHEGSYAELERCLQRLRAERRSQFWHLCERYLRCERRRTLGCPECAQATDEKVTHVHKLEGKQRKVERGWIVEERWNAAVREEKVRRGVEFIALEFRGSPFLPKDVLKEVAA